MSELPDNIDSKLFKLIFYFKRFNLKSDTNLYAYIFSFI